MPFDPILLDQLAQHPEWVTGEAAAAQPAPDAGVPSAEVANGSSDAGPLIGAAAGPAVPPTPAAPTVADTVRQAMATSQAPPGTSAGASVSTSHSGYNDATHRVLEGQMPAEQRAESAAAAAARAGESGEKAAAVGTARAAASATQEGSRAQQGMADATTRGDIAMARIQSHLADTEQMAAAHAQAVSAQYKSNLEADLARVRMMRVDSGKLLKDMTGGERLGTAASLFIQGFLGTRGIQTGAKEALQYWVERSVSDQEEAIKNGQQVVESDRMLWDMARAQSHDDAEARSRVQVYLLAQTQAEIKGQVDQYGSALAKANGDAAIAAIQGDLNKQLAGITDRFDAKAAQASAAVWEKHKFNVQMSHDSARLAISERAQALREKTAAQKAQKGVPEFFIFDTSTKGRDPKTGQSRASAKLKPEYAATKQAPVMAAHANAVMADAAEISELLEDYQNQANEVGRVLGKVKWGDMVRSPEGNQLIAKRDALVGRLARSQDPGARIIGFMIDQAAKTIQLDTMTGVGLESVNRMASDRVKEAITRAQIELSGLTEPVDPETSPRGGAIGVNGPGGAVLADAKATANPVRPATSTAQYFLGNTEGGGRADENAERPISPEFREQVRKWDQKDRNPGVHPIAMGSSDGYETNQVAAVDDLAEMAAGRRPRYSQEVNQPDALTPGPLKVLKAGKLSEERQLDAYTALSVYAEGLVKGGVNPDLREYAQSRLERINSDRELAGLSQFPQLTTQDLAGYLPDSGGTVANPPTSGSQKPGAPPAQTPADADADSDTDSAGVDTGGDDAESGD